MTLAALAEDPDRLRREWNECLRRTDELDPGGYPSEQTEQLFGELSRRRTRRRLNQASLAAIDDAPRSTRPSAPAAL